MSGEVLYPYDTIVYITDIMGGSTYQGSGVLVSPDEVLTASHVVYSSEYGVASDVTVTPGYSLGASPYGSTQGVSVHYNIIDDSGGVITLGDSQNDFALIRLAQPFTLDGTMGIESNYAGGLVNVSGYPAIDGGAQITDAEFVTRDPYVSLYEGTALGDGSSGGPVWIYGSNGDPMVVGLVSSANGTTGTGYFTEITTSVFNTIESWLQQDATSAVACFAAGTRIATPRGEIPVECLTTDDLVRTHSGRAAPVVWIGHRHIDCRRHPQPARVSPIRIRRGAFGRDRPLRDLRLSPDHAVFAGGALIPIRHLVNGATIVQEPPCAVTYWHVELPRHEIVRADGLPVESYLDTGNRACFGNGWNRLILHPDFGTHAWEHAACAGLLRDDARLTALRRRLHARALAAGYALGREPCLRVLADDKPLPAEVIERRWRVRIPDDTASVRLVSRTWVPAHARPGDTDHRRLGVAIAKLWFDGQEMGLDSPALYDGWHAAEPCGRWTDGDGRIPVSGRGCLEFVLAMTGAYWHPTPAAVAEARAA